jgi:drug/metabolite transporter (DMT)-like permease
VNYLGEIAAIGTAFTWSVGILLFTSASRRIGQFTMSHYRLLFAVIILFSARLIMVGTSFPVLSTLDWWLLSLSGVVGFFLCDICLFQSCLDASPRIGVLIFNLYPFFSAFFAWYFLREALALSIWIGIVVTTSGVLWVVTEKKDPEQAKNRPNFSRGILLGFSAAILQGVSFVLSKPAMTGHDNLDPLTATIIRAVFGCACYWIVSLVRGRIKSILEKFKERQSIKKIALGSIIGPSLGVTLSMVAIKYAPIGVASTIMSLMPITILPMTAIAHKERISFRAIIGAVIAFIGVAILFNARI